MPNRPSEDDLIARYFAPIAGSAGLALKDDAACLTPPPGADLVLTVDGLVAGVHFFPNDPPDHIARKALRVNLSDLAAKGAAPLGFLLTLALPADWTATWLEGFALGLGDDAARYNCPLLGGDTVKTPGPLTLSITAFGAVPTGRMVRRTGVRAGDRTLCQRDDRRCGAGPAGPTRQGDPFGRSLRFPAGALSAARAASRAERGHVGARPRRHGRVRRFCGGFDKNARRERRQR